MSLKIGALFAGMGGLDIAVESVLDSHVSWVAEFDDGPSRILAHRYPHAPNLGDVTKVDWSAVEPVDIMTAGYPCQPFSGAGLRLGAGDPRHLWPFVVEATAALRPPLCVFENVQGHLSLGFDHVLRDLHLLGYDVAWTLISAASVGAPHRRNRLFILAEDRHARPLLSRPDRRGGVHRYPGVGRIVPGAPQGDDDRQGVASLAAHEAGAWREDRRPAARDGGRPGVVLVEADRVGGERPHPRAEAVPAGEVGGSADRARVPDDGGRLAATAERPGTVDAGDARARVDAGAAHPGGQPPRPRPRATDTPAGDADGGLPLGLVVGAGAGPVRPGGTSGSPADERGDDRGPRVRDLTWGSREWRDLTLLPSPRASDTNGPGAHGTGGLDLRTAVHLLPAPRAEERQQRNSRDAGMALSALAPLLPTPTSADHKASGSAAYAKTDTHSVGTTLTDATVRNPAINPDLMPTPTAHDSKGTGPSQAERNSPGLDVITHLLPPVAQRITTEGPNDDHDPEGRPREVLRGVRREDGAEAVRHSARRSDAVPGAPNLLAELREYEARRREGHAPLASTEAPSANVRGVLDDAQAARAPRGPRPSEQRPDEPADAVRVVPPAPALAGGPGEAACGCAPWAGYASAIHRWEGVLGRPAPVPTEPTGKDGAHRLSARAVEFMMGLPSGWVTDPAIWEGVKPSTARNAQLKALGNGVVPQQAAAAIRHILAVRAAALGVAA